VFGGGRGVYKVGEVGEVGWGDQMEGGEEDTKGNSVEG